MDIVGEGFFIAAMKAVEVEILLQNETDINDI